MQKIDVMGIEVYFIDGAIQNFSIKYTHWWLERFMSDKPWSEDMILLASWWIDSWHSMSSIGTSKMLYVG